MKPLKPLWEAHLFVCTNERSKKECCAKKGAVEFRKELKSRFRERPPDEIKLRVNASGCLGRCSEGIAAILYPSGMEWGCLEASDIDSFEQEIRGHLNGYRKRSR